MGGGWRWGWRGERRGSTEAESLVFLFCSLECLNCWRVGGGRVRHKVLLRGDRKNIYRIPGFENVSPGDGIDCVKETYSVFWELTEKNMIRGEIRFMQANI